MTQSDPDDKLRTLVRRNLERALEAGANGEEEVNAALVKAAMDFLDGKGSKHAGTDRNNPASVMQLLEHARQQGGTKPDLDLEGDDPADS